MDYDELLLDLETTPATTAPNHAALRLAPPEKWRRCWACVWTHPDHPDGGITRGCIPRPLSRTLVRCPICRGSHQADRRVPALEGWCSGPGAANRYIGWVFCPVCRGSRHPNGKVPMLDENAPLAGLSLSVAIQAVAICCEMVAALPQHGPKSDWARLVDWWRNTRSMFAYPESQLPDLMLSRIKWATAEEGFDLETWHRRVRACVPVRDPWNDEIEWVMEPVTKSAAAAEPVPWQAPAGPGPWRFVSIEDGRVWTHDGNQYFATWLNDFHPARDCPVDAWILDIIQRHRAGYAVVA